jgi:hypothetical protein
MKVVRLSAPRTGQPLPSRGITGPHFWWRLRRPQGQRLSECKCPMIPSGIETFRRVAQCLNLLQHRVAFEWDLTASNNDLFLLGITSCLVVCCKLLSGFIFGSGFRVAVLAEDSSLLACDVVTIINHRTRLDSPVLPVNLSNGCTTR